MKKYRLNDQILKCLHKTKKKKKNNNNLFQFAKDRSKFDRN